MNIGFGSLKQMNDTLRYNREILPKRKSPREVYREEVKKLNTTGEGADLEQVRIRVREKLRRNQQSDITRRIAIVVVPVTVLALLIWFFVSVDFTVKRPVHHPEHDLFSSTTYPVSPGIDLKTEYFRSGPKAAETYYLDTLKHFDSESFYESGERFRFATYHQDTLLREVYYYKSGDTIRNFPVAIMDRIQHIELPSPDERKLIQFKFYDGKIVGGSYEERNLQTGRITP